MLWVETNLRAESDILKMDIEYAEFASLTSLDQAFPEDSGVELPIGQLMVELHLFGHEEMTGFNFLQWFVLFCLQLHYIYAFLHNSSILYDIMYSVLTELQVGIPGSPRVTACLDRA